MKSDKLYCVCIEQKPLRKIMQQYNESNKVIKQERYYMMNSKNNKTSDSHELLIKFKNKIGLKRSDKYFQHPNLSIY